MQAEASQTIGAAPSPARARLGRVGAAAVLLACLGYFALAIADQRHSLAEILTDPLWLIGLIGLAVPLQIGFATTAFAFARLVRDLGSPARFLDMFQVLLISQFAKYLPGNVAHHVGRVAMSRRHGVSLRAGSVAVTVEMLGSIVAATGLAVLCLLTQPQPWFQEAMAGITIRSSPLLIAGVVIAVAALVAAGLYLASRRIGRALLPGARSLAIALACYMVNFGVLIAVAAMLYAGLMPSEAPSLALVATACTVAWTLGAITPGAPGGLGVREVALVAFMAPATGEAAALAAALGLRLATTFADLLGFGLGLMLRRLTRERGTG